MWDDTERFMLLDGEAPLTDCEDVEPLTAGLRRMKETERDDLDKIVKAAFEAKSPTGSSSR